MYKIQGGGGNDFTSDINQKISLSLLTVLDALHQEEKATCNSVTLLPVSKFSI